MAGERESASKPPQALCQNVVHNAKKNAVNELKTIREYYKPIQPTVSANDNEISYQEIKPNKEIENFIYCFWQLKTQKPLKKDYNYRVVSDGCIDIFFDHKQPTENFVMGFCRKFVQFPIGKEFDYIGIRFLPSAFTHLFKVDARNFKQSIPRTEQSFTQIFRVDKFRNQASRFI
jgi:hypothetical protein